MNSKTTLLVVFCALMSILLLWVPGSPARQAAHPRLRNDRPTLLLYHCPVRQYQMCLLYVSSRRRMRSGRPAQQQGCFDADEAPNHCRIPGHMPGKPGPVHWHDGVHGPACVSDGESCNKKGTTVHLYFLVSNLEQVIGPERLYSIRQPSRHASLYGSRT